MSPPAPSHGQCSPLARNAGWLDEGRTRIAERRGRNNATISVARKLLTLVHYGLWDGPIPASSSGQLWRRREPWIWM